MQFRIQKLIMPLQIPKPAPLITHPHIALINAQRHKFRPLRACRFQFLRQRRGDVEPLHLVLVFDDIAAVGPERDASGADVVVDETFGVGGEPFCEVDAQTLVFAVGFSIVV